VDLCDFENCDCTERVRRFLAGDAGALDPRIERLTPYIRGIARNVLRSSPPDDWDEAASEALLHVVRKLRLAKWEGEGRFCYWVKTVAIHRILDLRDQARSRVQGAPFPPLYEVVAPQAISPDFTDRLADMQRCYEKVCAGLKPIKRQVFDLVYKEERSARNVAQITHVPARTVFEWLKTIRELIRNCMEAS
jgi:RNA polymerase sigma factor (sigma-70 family)